MMSPEKSMEYPKISPEKYPPSAKPIMNEKMSPTESSGMRLISPRTHALRIPKIQAMSGSHEADGRTAHTAKRNQSIGRNHGNGLSVASSLWTSRILHTMGINMCAETSKPVTRVNQRTRTSEISLGLSKKLDSRNVYAMP